MTIIEISSKGTIQFPEPLQQKLAHIRYFQVTDTKKGILLTPVQIQPATPVK